MNSDLEDNADNKKSSQQNSPADVVSSSTKTANGLEKLKSLLKTNFTKGDGTPRKSVSFQIPEDIKKLYEDDPEIENFVLAEMEKEKARKEEELAKLQEQRKNRASDITAKWLTILKEEEEKKKAQEVERKRLLKEQKEAEKRAAEEARLAAEKKKLQLEEEIRKKVLAEKRKKEEEAAEKEAKRKERLEAFVIENKIRKENGMETLSIPPELLDPSVPEPEDLKKPEDIKKEKVNTPQKSFSTPPAKVLSVAESVKRRIISDPQTPSKKAKKDDVQDIKEFAALLLSPSKRRVRQAQNNAEQEYKMLCKQKEKLMLEADSFLNLEHGESDLDAIYTRLFEHSYALNKEELVCAQRDSFFRIMKYSFEDLVRFSEDEVVEKIRWRLSTYVGDNLTTWSCVSIFMRSVLILIFPCNNLSRFIFLS